MGRIVRNRVCVVRQSWRCCEVSEKFLDLRRWERLILYKRLFWFRRTTGMSTGNVTVIFRVRPQTQETDVRVKGMLATLSAERSRVVARMGHTPGSRPFGWRRPRIWRGEMMTSTKTRRMRRGGIPWWMTGLAMMRGRSPVWRSGGSPSRPLSRAGPEGPTRGSRATPVPMWRWRRRRWVASPKPLGAWGPRSGRALRARPTFQWTTVIGPRAG